MRKSAANIVAVALGLPFLKVQMLPLSAVLLFTLLQAVPASSQVADPSTLAEVEVPEPRNLHMFVKDKEAAIRLGKALFWDMQVGSDGITACASCHFHAGTDNRVHNSLNPGLLGGDETFQTHRAGGTVTLDDFPFFELSDPEDRFSTVLRDSNDVLSSQGVPLVEFERVRQGQAVDAGQPLRDATFNKNLRNVRRVEPRNTPTVINSVFNFTNFWDGRASHFFNGVNPFGQMDRSARVLVHNNGVLSELDLTDLQLDANGFAQNPYVLDNASLASQAVGPPLSDFEMSWRGRTWPDIGRKLLPLRPLAMQKVHPQDSALAGRIHPSGAGLTTTYEEMVRAAFRDEFWNAAETVTFAQTGEELVHATDDDPRTLMLSAGKATIHAPGTVFIQTEGGEPPFSQIEVNFSLFFGLALQLYQATLVSDDTPFDRFVAGDESAMTPRQQRGMSRFFSDGAGCANCHFAPEFTGATVRFARNPDEAGLIELMAMGDGNLANYDIGFYNIGVRPTAEDIGRGGSVTFDGQTLPLSFSRQFMLSLEGELPFEPIAQPGCVNDFLAEPPTICPPPTQINQRVAVDGGFKTPGLRNLELTGPYMHNGGMATLMQVVDFYVRGGDFREANMENLDPFIEDIAGMKGNPAIKEELVDFLIALTDERVKWERAPFDHPQLFIPDGHLDRIPGNPKTTRVLADRMVEIPAVGAAGRAVEGLGPLKPFLADDLEGANLTNFHFQQ